MKKWVVGMIAVLTLSLSGCSGNGQASKKSTRLVDAGKLSVDGKKFQADADDSNNAKVKVHWKKGAKFTLSTDVENHSQKADKDGNTTFTIMAENWDVQAHIKATSGHKYKTADFEVTLDPRTEAENESRDKSSSVAESKSVAAESISESKSEAAASSKAATKKAALEAQWKPVEHVFDMTSIMKQSDSTLFSKGAAVSLNSYKIVDFGADNMGQYHVLISPPDYPSDLFLVVFKRSKGQHLSLYDTPTVRGTLNGTSHLNSAQVKSGISASYANKKVILILADRVSF